MRFQLAPLEKREGHWQVNILPLAIWVFVFNLVFMAGVYYWPASPTVARRPVPARAMKHPVAVIGRGASLRERADDAAKQLTTLRQGDTVDLYVAQPEGWYFVTLPDSQPVDYGLRGYNGGAAGYVRQQALQVPDSTLRHIREQQ